MIAKSEIPHHIEAPLQFVMKNSRRNLPRLRDLGSTMKVLLRKLREAYPADVDRLKIAASLEALFQDFDNLALPLREKRVKQALVLVELLKAPVSEDTSRAVAAPVDDSVGSSQALLSRPAHHARGVGPKIARLLAAKGIATLEDLLYFIPHRYEDRRSISSIADALPGTTVTIQGTVTRSVLKRYSRRSIYEVDLCDESGMMTALWLRGNPAYLQRLFNRGTRCTMTGTIKESVTSRTMIHPDYELLGEEGGDSLNTGRVVPIYSEADGLPQKTIRRIMASLLQDYGMHRQVPIPEDTCRRKCLLSMDEAIRNIHFPPPDAVLDEYNGFRSPAHRRIIFEEFFYFELGMALRKEGYCREKGIAFRSAGILLENFYKHLAFELTAGQKRAIEEILSDMGRPHPMYRLLQGDVGCGKTVVAMVPLIRACENGFQAALMAPTELLAEQHHRTVGSWAEALGLKTLLLTGSLKGQAGQSVRDAIAEGRVDIIIGTHALIQEKVDFHRLGVVVIDEQHRFGVAQRARLKEKGFHPDVLVMTATPIPRTLAMTVYGDLSSSVIDEMPPRKKQVKTVLLSERSRNRAYDMIRKECEAGNQAFIVYPLVAESETLDLKDATTMAGHLQREIFTDRMVGLIHGRMKKEDRDKIMEDFRLGAIDILVATTVVEVGIDISAASIMMIEQAERFGLSQLHQLRGRVGRGDRRSYCILLAGPQASLDARKRLGVMERSGSGFEIAEEDLKIRGPGEFLGVRQSGFPDFRIGDILRDGPVLEEARQEAFLCVEQSQHLQDPEYVTVKRVFEDRWRFRFNMAGTG